MRTATLAALTLGGLLGINSVASGKAKTLTLTNDTSEEVVFSVIRPHHASHFRVKAGESIKLPLMVTDDDRLIVASPASVPDCSPAPETSTPSSPSSRASRRRMPAPS